MTAKKQAGGRSEFTVPVRVEFDEVDSYRVVHHTKLIVYLERARVRYFESLGFDLKRRDLTMLLYRLDMRFKKPARFTDLLDVSVSVSSVTATEVVLGYKIRRDGELLAKAETALAFADPESGAPVPVPEDFAAALNAS